MVVDRRQARGRPKFPPTRPTVTARKLGGGTRRGIQEMVGFSQGPTAASTAPLGSGAIVLQAPTPGDQ
jgi:hypothetical protein